MPHTTSRLFPLKDVLWFAEVSGDPNPVHIDPEWAAQTYPGAVVAHGIHMAMWALETLPAQDTAPLELEGFRAIFQRPVVVEEEVSAETLKPGSIGLKVGEERSATVRLKGGEPPERWTPSASSHVPTHPPVLQGAHGTIEAVRGALRLPERQDALLAAFPNLGRRLGARALRGLAGIAPVSGGVLGGVTTEIAVRFTNDSPGDNLEYRLLAHREAFNRYELAFWGHGVIGMVAAMAGNAVRAK